MIKPEPEHKTESLPMTKTEYAALSAAISGGFFLLAVNTQFKLWCSLLGCICLAVAFIVEKFG